MTRFENTYHTHTWDVSSSSYSAPGVKQYTPRKSATTIKVYICAFSCLICHNIYLQTSVSAYDIQFHHCHQCSVESYHNGRKSGYTDHCCTGMLHFDRKLQKLEERCLQLLGYKNWKTLETMRNLLQLHSSVPSEHVRFPSHREEEEMHWPLAHRNWVELQPIMYSMCVTEYRYVTCMLQLVISYSDK